MTEIEKLKSQIKKQEEYIDVIKTEQLSPAIERLNKLIFKLVVAEFPFSVGDSIVDERGVEGVLIIINTDDSFCWEYDSEDGSGRPYKAYVVVDRWNFNKFKKVSQ